MLVLLWIVSSIISLLIAGITYYIACVPQEKIAAKLGHASKWMAYVPFARGVQKVAMVGMPTWKFIFLDAQAFWIGLIGGLGALFMFIHPGFGIAVLVLLLLAYLVMFIMFSYDYNSRLADSFGFDKGPMALIWTFSLITSVFSIPIIYLIALSDKYQLKGKEVHSAGQCGTAPVAFDGPVGLAGISGMYSGANFPMSDTDEFVIGRDSALSNIIISANGDKVSRRHCTVKYIKVTGCYEVTDFSSNGTFYGNTRLLKGQPTSIPRGTTIVIGDKMNQFKLM